MARARRRGTQRSDSATGWRGLRPRAARAAQQLLALVGGLAVTTTGILLSPLRDNILHAVWGESVQMVLTPDATRVKVGEQIAVRVRAAPSGVTGVADGVLTLSISDTILKFLGDSTQYVHRLYTTDNWSVVTSAFNAPTILPSGGSYRLAGVGAGRALLRATLDTRHGTYRDSVEIVVEARDTAGIPSVADFTGKWSISFGGTSGEMNLRQDGGRVTGSYSLGDGLSGAVDGLRDGTVFYASFYRGEAPSRTVVDARWTIGQGYIELVGDASTQVLAPTGWSTAETTKFRATSEHR